MQFRLTAILYAFAVFAAGITTFGSVAGILLSGAIVAFWMSSRKRTALGCVVPLALVLLCAALLLPAVGSARSAARRSACANNMKLIMLALLNYEAARRSRPPAYISDASGKPMHSWRVLILPYLGENALYNAYNFDEPWDGPNNRKLADRMPAVYRCPSCEVCAALPGNPLGVSTGNATNYLVVVSDETPLQPDRGVKMREIRDGTSNTISVIDCAAKSVHWMAPEDLTMDEAVALLSDPQAQRHVRVSEEFFVTRYRTGRGNVARVDGSVYDLPAVIADEARALLTIAGGESLGDDYEQSPGPPTTIVTVHWARVFSFSVFVALAVLPVFVRKRVQASVDDAQPVPADDQE